jgi:ComF family protein
MHTSERPDPMSTDAGSPGPGSAARKPWRWPSLCPACDRWSLGPRLCDDCRRDLAPHRLRCAACALTLDDHGPACDLESVDRPYARVQAAVDYRFPWDALVRRFKSAGDLGLAVPLADLMVERAALPLPDPRTVVVPVPAARSRLAARGYHPAWELARRVARLWGLPAEPHVLERRMDRAQTGRRGADRFANLRAAYAAAPLARRVLAQRSVLLVDDVMTTGATLQATARLLRQAGAARVDALVLARTPRPATAVIDAPVTDAPVAAGQRR